MNFKNWLYNEAQEIAFTAISNDGKIYVDIKGKKYVYLVSNSRIANKIYNWGQHASGKALAEIKRLINLGFAKQIQPNILPIQPIIPPKIIQKTLF